MDPIHDYVSELISLRAMGRHSVQQAAPTLVWFADQVTLRQRIPLNIWRRLDRPLPRESKTLGLAFDLWDAIQRVERTLRLSSPSLAGELRKKAGPLRTTLQELSTFPGDSQEVGEDKGPEVCARRLVSDEVFGTFNALSAASVLRSEAFSERSVASPSYLAGHVVLAELKIARNLARAHSISGIRERSPRLYVVAQAVHCLMSYVEHLRGRATAFDALAEQLKLVTRVNGAIEGTTGTPPPELDHVWDSHVRLAVTRLAPLCDTCASLILATRPFFEEWQHDLEKLETTDRPLSSADLDGSLGLALAALAKAGVEACRVSQQAAFKASVDFCNQLSTQIRQVYDGLQAVFGISEKNSYGELIEKITRLEGSLDGLARTHLGGTQPGEYPTILDAARFQFARMLVRRFRDKNGLLLDDRALDKAPEKAQELTTRLNELRQTYRIGSGPAPMGTTGKLEAIRTIRALGESSMGRSVLEWWRNYDECYECPPSTAFEGKTPGEYPDADSLWMSLRHRSFHAIADLTNQLISAKEVEGAARFTRVADVLSEAARTERRIADRIEVQIKDVTQWCSGRGHQILLAGRNQMSTADPIELASALWIAERINESWNERLEQQAFETISELQRTDGSFSAVAPLYHNRWFTFYLPSANVIALLARFVTAGADSPKRQALQARLRRWAPVLLKGARFLNETLVGGGPESDSDPDKRDWAGWHSDRHPEAERIDCLTTTEAVTALCRLDDAIKWLINLEIVGEFSVAWPDPIPSSSLMAVDGEAGRDQLQLKVAPLVRRFREYGERFNPRRGPASDNRGVASHAFVFYGPPGTGKTFFQQIVAGELGWPVVTLTIGDFLHDGEDRVGRRAHEIFKRLSLLSNVCIVFDEFDEMVTARSRKGEQGWTGFPLLTATMLPLLTILRNNARSQCCVVSFTTNYIENIDQAATRVGRIDEAILLTYPDYSSRLLLGLMARATHEATHVNWELLCTIARDTALCSQPDVRAYIEESVKSGVDRVSRPKPPIDSTYYDGIDWAGRGAATAGVERLFRSIGPDHVVATWLNDHPSWRTTYERLRGRTDRQVERRASPRQRFRGQWPCESDCAGRVLLRDISPCGVGMEAAAELPERFTLRIPSADLQAAATYVEVSANRRWAMRRQSGTWFVGARVDQLHNLEERLGFVGSGVVGSP